MYQYLDRPMNEFTEGDRVLVWAMRRWLSAVRQQECPMQPIGAMFSARRILPALAPFEQMMILLSQQARQVLVFAPLRCRSIAEAEALLLSLIAGALRDPPERTHATALLIVGQANSGRLVDSLMSLAVTLSAAGLTSAALD